MNLTPAQILVLRFGGVRKTARAIGRSPAAVSKWTKNETREGLKGTIPSAVQPHILMLARKLGLDLTAEDLILGRKLTRR